MTNTVSFFGADHKCGTGMISQCVAERIAAVMPDLKILLLHANGRSGSDYSPTVSESMDNIRPYLADRLVDSREILEKSRWKDNLFVIAGTEEIGSFASFNPDMTSYMLESLRKDADLILCDSGCEIEHGLSLGSLLSSDHVYMVMTQNESALRRYEWQKNLFEKLGIFPGRFIINKFDKGSPYNVRYIGERLALYADQIMTVRLSEYGMRAEYDERSLVNYPGSGFKRDIDAIACKVLEDSGLKMVSRR